MARVKLAPFITSISGSIGGLTIQRNKYGLTARSKPLPIKSASPSQLHIRHLMITIQSAWQNLTDSQRLQWNRFLDYSSQTILHDKSVKLSGHALYLKYQLFRLLSGNSLLTDITYITMPSVPAFDYFNVASPLFLLHFISAIDASDYIFLLKVTTPRQVNKSFSFIGLRFMSVVYSDTFTFNFASAYIAAFGVLPSIGDTIHYSLRWFSMLSPIYGGVITSTSVLQ